MIATDTAKTVVLILFGLSILWIVVIVIKNDMQTLVRALIVTALLGLALYYLNQTKLEQLSFNAIKDDLFPIKARAYTVQQQEGFIAGSPSTTYTFEDPGPRLPLAMISGGKYMAIKDIRTVNSVLQYLGLPPVKQGVPEFAAITGLSIDADKFRWDDYDRGILIIERGLCRDMSSAESFTCIGRIIVMAR
jgi:hypothetical protein